MAEPRKVYWDACVWIALIQGEVGRVERCDSLIALAKAGEVQIWTSSLTLAEVYKHRSTTGRALTPDKDQDFEAFLEQDFIVEAQVDHDVGVVARRLLRLHNPVLKRCPDAIHLATAVVHNLDELHTFDGHNLIPLNSLVLRANNTPLLIREPPESVVVTQVDMFAPPGIVVPEDLRLSDGST